MHVGLDAAFPPTAPLWVQDMNAVGADVGFIYVYGPYLNYTPTHKTMAEAAGKHVMPIVVPGNKPPTYGVIWAALLGYGFGGGPVWVDREPGSEPADSWVQGLRAFLDPLGYRTDTYCMASECGKFTPEDGEWVASWIRTGTLNPLPAMPQGRHAWQFVNDVSINGRQYDASIVDDTFITGEIELTPEQVQMLRDIWFFLLQGADEPAPGGTLARHDSILLPMSETVTGIAAQVAKLGTGPASADASAIASDLAANPTFLAAVAKAVAQELGKTLSGAA
jgi:hypothetical protein